MCLGNCGFIFNGQICEYGLDISQKFPYERWKPDIFGNMCFKKGCHRKITGVKYVIDDGWLPLTVSTGRLEQKPPELSKMSAVKMTIRSFDTVQQTRKACNRSDKCFSKLEWSYKWAIRANFCKLVKLSEQKVVLHDNKVFSLALHSIGFTFSWICFSQADSQTQWCKLSQLKRSGWRQTE